MADRAQAAGGIHGGRGRHHGLLPEAPAGDRQLAGYRGPRAGQAERGVQSARHDRCAGGEARLAEHRPGYLAYHRPGLDHLGEPGRLQAAQRQQFRGPGPPAEIEQARGGADRRFGSQRPGEPEHHPVGDQAESGGRRPHRGLVAAHPGQPGRGAERDPAAAPPVQLGGGPVGQHGCRLPPGPGVAVGTGPQLLPAAAVEHQPAAHAGAADRPHRRRARRAAEHLADAGADQRPVTGRVEGL